MAVAEGAAVSDAGTLADWARGAAAVALGMVLVGSARRSVPARIAVSAVATLLVVVLAVSLALSIVISGNVEREALRRVAGRALAEAEEVQISSGRDARNSAKLVRAHYSGPYRRLPRRPVEPPGGRQQRAREPPGLHE